MGNFLKALKAAITGDYASEATPSAGIEPTAFDAQYSVAELHELFERGMRRSASNSA